MAIRSAPRGHGHLTLFIGPTVPGMSTFLIISIETTTTLTLRQPGNLNGMIKTGSLVDMEKLNRSAQERCVQESNTWRMEVSRPIWTTLFLSVCYSQPEGPDS